MKNKIKTAILLLMRPLDALKTFVKESMEQNELTMTRNRPIGLRIFNQNWFKNEYLIDLIKKVISNFSFKNAYLAVLNPSTVLVCYIDHRT